MTLFQIQCILIFRLGHSNFNFVLQTKRKHVLNFILDFIYYFHLSEIV
jgi:hypothetical protein